MSKEMFSEWYNLKGERVTGVIAPMTGDIAHHEGSRIVHIFDGYFWVKVDEAISFGMLLGARLAAHKGYV